MFCFVFFPFLFLFIAKVNAQSKSKKNSSLASFLSIALKHIWLACFRFLPIVEFCGYFRPEINKRGALRDQTYANYMLRQVNQAPTND